MPEETKGKWRLSDSGWTVYELSDGREPVNLWSAQVQRDPRRFTAGQAADVARLMRSAKEMAEALEAIWDETCGFDLACEFCEGRAPTCDAGPTGPIVHKGDRCPRVLVEAALRSAGRLP